MKRIITIILTLIMALFTAPNQGADQADVSHVNAPQTAITASVEQEPVESEIPAETAKLLELTEAGTEAAEVEMQTETLTEETTEEIITEPELVEETIPEEPITEEITEAIEIEEETIIAQTEKPSKEELNTEEPSNAPEYKPSIGGGNPFENETPTEIDDRPVEDFIGEDEDRPGEGKHF